MEYTITSYAKHTGLTRQAIWGRIKRGTLPARKVGAIWVITIDEGE